MTPAKPETTCGRSFQVEALRDGRLGGAERKSFERHLAACALCAREAAALEELAAAARAARDDGRGDDELRVWRERTRLLAAFDRALVSSARGGRIAGASRRRWLVPATVAVLAAALVVIWRGRPAIEPAPAAQASVQADAAATWSRRRGGGGREEITLRQGTLRIHVEHAAVERGEPPLLVLLPDGELEDVGTTFTVSADDAHTSRVAVADGRVVLRLRGRPGVDIGAGDVWSPAPPPAAPVAPPAPATTERAAGEHRPARPARAPRASASPPADAPDALVEFRAASAALRAGDNRRAASAFARFVEEHARDPMAEDAAYLRLIALQRMGAGTETKRAAEEYLRRFPTGFRRAEVERLAGHPGDLP
jgi:hypothetical protein